MNIRHHPLSTAMAVTALAVVSACSSSPTRDARYVGGPVDTQPSVAEAPVYIQAPAYAEFGTVRSIDIVPIESPTRGGGAVLGAVLGGVVGNTIGAGTGRGAATVAGVIGGGIAGNEIEKRTRRSDEVFHVGVRFDDGRFREFDFQRVDDLRVGDRVRWEAGQLQRL